MSPRSPRLTPSGVQQSLDVLDAVDTLLVLLKKRHPNAPLLPAAHSLLTQFSRELSALAPAVAEAPELPAE